jgi:hypothetical protein
MSLGIGRLLSDNHQRRLFLVAGGNVDSPHLHAVGKIPVYDEHGTVPMHECEILIGLAIQLEADTAAGCPHKTKAPADGRSVREISQRGCQKDPG